MLGDLPKDTTRMYHLPALGHLCHPALKGQPAGRRRCRVGAAGHRPPKVVLGSQVGETRHQAENLSLRKTFLSSLEPDGGCLSSPQRSVSTVLHLCQALEWREAVLTCFPGGRDEASFQWSRL